MKLEQLKNQSVFDQKRAHFFRKNGSNVLFALAVDYPGLRKIPLEYLDLARRELRRIGFRSGGGGLKVRSYRIFYLGPRLYRHASWTPRHLAHSFRIFLYNASEAIERAK